VGGVSEGVSGTRTANRDPLTLTLTLAAHAGRPRGFTGRITHASKPREHGAQAVEQRQQRRYFALGREVEHQYALATYDGDNRVDGQFTISICP
jgi:hypothetical protein